MPSRKQDIIDMFETMEDRHTDIIVWYNEMKPEFSGSEF